MRSHVRRLLKRSHRSRGVCSAHSCHGTWTFRLFFLRLRAHRGVRPQSQVCVEKGGGLPHQSHQHTFPMRPGPPWQGTPQPLPLDTARTSCGDSPNICPPGLEPSRLETGNSPPSWGRPNLVLSWHHNRDFLARVILTHKLDTLSEPSWPTHWTSCRAILAHKPDILSLRVGDSPFSGAPHCEDLDLASGSSG